MRRNPGQAVNLAHLIWRRPCAPAPLPSNKGKSQTPGGFSSRGYGCFSYLSPPCGARGEEFYLEGLCRRLCPGKGLSRVWARKMGRQGVKSASPTREARPLTHQLAQKELSGGFKTSAAWLEPFLSERSFKGSPKAPDVEKDQLVSDLPASAGIRPLRP